MTQLRGYAVFKAWPSLDDRPFCIVRVTANIDVGTSEHEVVADHGSYNIACYWAHQLNAGLENEESVKRKIAEGTTPSPRRG